MNKEAENRRETPEFKFEDILKSPEGVVQHFTSPMPDRKGDLKLVITDGMGIVDGTMITDRETEPWGHFNEMALVEMNFILEGNIYQTHEGILNRYLYAKGYHNILFNPHSFEKNELIGKGAYRIFTVSVSPQRMINLFSGYIPEFAHLAEKIDKGVPFVLHTPANGFAGNMKYIFDYIWDCPAPLSLRKLHFESKILDLLSRQSEILINNNIQRKETIHKSDLDKVYYAREIMLNKLSAPPSLSELSKLCGLNEFKLKKYFKQVFKTSVFGFVNDEKLEEAKRLIYQGEKNISAVAYELGYAHTQHFQRAFKKRFGITPKALLK